MSDQKRLGRPLSELSQVNWADLEHAYGSAEDVPAQLEAIATGDEEAYQNAFGNLWHQWTTYSATAAAIPFLLGVLEGGTRNADMLFLLGCMAWGNGDEQGEVLAQLWQGVNAVLPHLAAPDRETASGAVYLLGGLLSQKHLDWQRVWAALHEAARTHPTAEVQAACLYHLRRHQPYQATEAYALGKLASAEAEALKLCSAIYLAHQLGQGAPPTVAQALQAAIAADTAEDTLGEPEYMPCDPNEEMVLAAVQLRQAQDFAALFEQQAERTGDPDYLFYARSLLTAHEENIL